MLSSKGNSKTSSKKEESKQGKKKFSANAYR